MSRGERILEVEYREEKTHKLAQCDNQSDDERGTLGG